MSADAARTAAPWRPLPEDRTARGWLAAWTLLAAALFGTHLYGLELRDVVAGEIPTLLSALPSHPAAADFPVGRYGALLGRVLPDPTPRAVRLVAALAVALAVALAAVWCHLVAGRVAGCATLLLGLAATGVAPAAWHAAPHAAVALLLVAGLLAGSVAALDRLPTPRAPFAGRFSWAVLALVLLRGAYVLADAGTWSLSAPASQRWLALGGLGLRLLPVALLALAALAAGGWPLAARDARANLVTACVVAGFGVAWAALFPAQMQAATVIATCGLAMLFGLACAAEATGRLTATAAAWHRRVPAVVALALPVTMAVVALARIGSRFNLMEKVQAATVVAAAALAIALWALARRGMVRRYGLACSVLALAVVGRYELAHVVFAEHDQTRSSRRAALAVRREIPVGAALATDLPVDDVFRWYLRRPLVSTAAAPADAYRLTAAPSSTGRLVRVYRRGPARHRLYGPTQVAGAGDRAAVRR